VLAPTQPPPVAGAAELFGRANDARREGDVGAARALYREVAERFPGSAEARLARVSLGKLLLGAGDVRAAEAEFARYLAAGGPLVQEALVGRAECLRRLGRSDDERRVWQQLVDEFPGGVYEPQARSRLAELGGVDPTPTPGP
jgi:TolA-binding protein